MNQPNQNKNPDNSGDTPLKRKRGRPRKHPRPDAEGNAYVPKDQNINRNPVSGENARAPPGFYGVNGNQPGQRDQEIESNDAMVGQVVSGVIEAVFDAGYLLSVRVGNSDTTLRGLVFKPGRYVPVSAENDVARGVPMIRRNEVPFSTANCTQVRYPQPKGRNEQHVNIYKSEAKIMNGSPSVTQVPRGVVSSSHIVASEGKNVPSVAEQTIHSLAICNVVPVVLQPGNSSNGVAVSDQPSQLMTQASLGIGSSVTKDIPANENQAPSSQTQTSQNMLPRAMQIEDGSHQQSSDDVLREVEAKSLRLPFENLVTGVIKKIPAPSEPMDIENNIKSGDQTLDKDSSSRQEDRVNDMDQPILIKPLQAVQSGPEEHSVSGSRALDNNETGRMSELLQVLQDSSMENQVSKADEGESGDRLDGTRNFENELEDGETGQSAK